MDEILLAIEQHLYEQCTFAKHIDFNEGQLDYYGSEIPLKYPAILIDFQDANFTDTSQLKQNGTATFTFTIATQKLTNSSAKAPVEQKRKSLEILVLSQLLHEKIHGWRPTQKTGKLLRRRISKQRRDDAILVYILTYTMSVSNT